MQGTVLYGPRDIRFEDRETPKIEKSTELRSRTSAYWLSVLECVGTQESMMQAIHSTRPGGFVSYVGVPHDVELNGQQMFFTHVHLHGGPAPVRRYLPNLIDLVLNEKINPEKCSTSSCPWSKWRKSTGQWTSGAQSKHYCDRKET